MTREEMLALLENFFDITAFSDCPTEALAEIVRVVTDRAAILDGLRRIKAAACGGER